MLAPRRIVVCLLVASGLTLGSGLPAMAGPATERVREFFASADRIIVDPAYDARPEERLTALRGLVAEMVDFRHAAAVALASEWELRSAGERDEFVRLFADLLETSVFASVGSRARIDRGLTVTYTNEALARETTTVLTTVLTRSGREMSVGFRMAHPQERWIVQDLVVDGVSLVENYRAQFQKFMQRSSYAGLVSEMRARITDLGRYTPTAVAVNAPVAILPARAGIAPIPPPPVVVTATPPREDVAPITPPAIAVASPPSIVVAAVTPRESRPPELRVPDVRAETTPPAARLDRYWVQVGAFRSPEKAMQVATSLRDHTVSLFSTPDDPWLRVAVGPFVSRDTATSKLREIRARGYDAFIAESSK